ncbi:MAG: PEP-CTERM sorting domain-containing protein [Desulfobacteraceae bacterium]
MTAAAGTWQSSSPAPLPTPPPPSTGKQDTPQGRDPIPEPGTFFLLGSGVILLAGTGRKLKRLLPANRQFCHEK